MTDPVRNYTFDFRHLGSELGYHLPADEDHPGHYLFNICKKLSNKCNNQTDVGACYVDGNKKEFVIGKQAWQWNKNVLILMEGAKL